MREALAIAMSGHQSLAHSDTRERAIDRIGAAGAAQIRAKGAEHLAFLTTLGRNAFGFKFAHRPECKPLAEEDLAIELNRAKYRLHCREHGTRLKIARHAVYEYHVDMCGRCSGRGFLPLKGIGDGPQPTIQCPSCYGNPKKPSGDKQIDTALSILYRSEALFVRATGKMLERWGLDRPELIL